MQRDKSLVDLVAVQKQNQKLKIVGYKIYKGSLMELYVEILYSCFYLDINNIYQYPLMRQVKFLSK